MKKQKITEKAKRFATARHHIKKMEDLAANANFDKAIAEAAQFIRDTVELGGLPGITVNYECDAVNDGMGFDEILVNLPSGAKFPIWPMEYLKKGGDPRLLQSFLTAHIDQTLFRDAGFTVDVKKGGPLDYIDSYGHDIIHHFCILPKITDMIINDNLVLKKTSSMNRQDNGLYQWQEECLQKIGNDDAVVVAPPGSGKSLVAYNWAKLNDREHRTVITCPTKAKVTDYAKELRDAGIDVGVNTGDNKENLSAGCVVCTQEVYNAIYADKPGQMVIIDEFHYALDDPVRRDAYMYGIQATNQASKLLVMSATLSDSKYVAEELGKVTGRNFKHFTTDARATDTICRNVPFSYNEVNNALVFAFRVSEVYDIAETISKTRNDRDYEKENVIDKVAEIYGVKDEELINLCHTGVAVYYGKMHPNEKAFVAQLCQDKIIDTIVGTDALSVGINFPVEKVIFTSLEKMDKPLTDKEIVQMAMRAGRNGLCDHGEIGVLLQDKEYKGDIREYIWTPKKPYYNSDYEEPFTVDNLYTIERFCKRANEIRRAVAQPEYEQENLEPVDMEKVNFLGQDNEEYDPFYQECLSGDETKLIDGIVYNLCGHDSAEEMKFDATFTLQGSNDVSLTGFLTGRNTLDDIKPFIDRLGLDFTKDVEEDVYDDYDNYLETEIYQVGFQRGSADALSKLQAYRRYMDAWNRQIDKWNSDPESEHTNVHFSLEGIDKEIDQLDPTIFRLDECIRESREIIQEYKDQAPEYEYWERQFELNEKVNSLRQTINEEGWERRAVETASDIMDWCDQNGGAETRDELYDIVVNVTGQDIAKVKEMFEFLARSAEQGAGHDASCDLSHKAAVEQYLARENNQKNAKKQQHRQTINIAEIPDGRS